MSQQDKEQGLTTGSLSDRPENSAIKQATPKQGLISGSARDAVAKEYAPLLSGAKGDRAQFDAVLELIHNEISFYEDSKIVSSNNGDSFDGLGPHKTLKTRKTRGGASTIAEESTRILSPWDIEVVDADAGSVKIFCGTIIKTASDLTGQITITGATNTFTPSASQVARLKLAGTFDAPTATLEVAGDWTDYPAAYETTSSGATAALAAYFYPLWEFVSTPDADTIPIKSGVHARKLVGPHHFLRNSAAYHEAGNKPFAVPFLVPYHRALTP
jgi:hypothetical protein